MRRTLELSPIFRYYDFSRPAQSQGDGHPSRRLPDASAAIMWRTVSLFLGFLVARSTSIALTKIGSPAVTTAASSPPPLWSRRRILFHLVIGAPTTVAAADGNTGNPFTLRGQFWETGKPYKASDKESLAEASDQYLLEGLQDAARRLKSLDALAEDGQFGEITSALRGGQISEPRIRMSARILLEREEDDQIETRAQAIFSGFTVAFDKLDEAVITASRRAPGGFTGTLGMAVISPFQAAGEVARVASASPGDDRIEVLGALGETVSRLNELCRALGVGVEARGRKEESGGSGVLR